MSKKRSAPAHGRSVHRRHHRLRRDRYLVVCGGEVTERQYFEHCAQEFNVDIRYKPKVYSPSAVAKYAAQLKKDEEAEVGDDAEAYKKVWVVVDVDHFHDHAEAERICKANGMRLIISNPCFEVWLIDHIQRCPESYKLTKDVERYASQLGITKGPRNKYIEFSAIEGKTVQALTNASRHNSNRYQRQQLTVNSEQDYAPWTDMPEVIEELRK
ncbi:RloB family protein [Bifidobacterium sp. ESL0732]|uniref:RloB family protein n=1 Tax=Bifidobacterium sp. ESL0732 TaxID=2983222 RepID=UPI0023FA0B85|nr:RloB family protein [Bifidobacterium sp. ESL0732]WEV64530.1 RloB family protein [Bifidobacterium sp. ESL0732]